MAADEPIYEEIIDGFEGSIKVLVNFDKYSIGKAIASKIGKRVSFVVILDGEEGQEILDFFMNNRPLALSFMTTSYPGMREEV